MGFGHRVYKNYDPRAGVLKESADDVLAMLGQKNNPKLAIAKELERIALNDDYFAQRKLFPNVDFYSGIILEAMGIPTTMFTAIFALARTVGWVAQWNEMIEDPEQKIGRPRQRYTGQPAAQLRADRASAADAAQPVMIFALNSASAARVPSTRARPSNFHTPSLLRRTVISTRS